MGERYGSKAGILFVFAVLLSFSMHSGGAERVQGKAGFTAKIGVRKMARKAGVRYVEVEIRLSEEFDLAYISGLPRAAGNEPEVSGDSRRVKVQLPESVVGELAEDGAEVEAVRNFVFIEGSGRVNEGLGGDIGPLATCSGPYEEGSNGLNYYIEDSLYWYGSGIDFTGSPVTFAVNCIDIHYVVRLNSFNYFDVAFSDEDGDNKYWLEQGRWGANGDIIETMTGITGYNGEPINQWWVLWAGESATSGYSYIDSWWIKLYYEEDYCYAEGHECDTGDYISRVQVGDIDNSSGCDNYGDYTSLSTSMEIGEGYAIQVDNYNPYDDQDQCGIWVDWNHDLDFKDAGETISVSGTPGYGPYTATITPPSWASLGDTRMRVRIRWTGDLEPCAVTPYGDVEDYTIIVTSEPSILSISGYVKMLLGMGIEGVSLSADNGGGSDVTDVDGYYELTVPDPWTGTLTPSDASWTFQPLNRSYTGLDANVSDVNFTGLYMGDPDVKISGYVKTEAGFGIEGVLVESDHGESDTTDEDGYYELILPSPWYGTITPSKALWSFSPPYREDSGVSSDVADANFTGSYAAEANPMISGYVKTATGAGIEGVQVAGDGLYDGSTMTDANGYYELTVPDLQLPVPEPWSGTVMPNKTDWSFTPPNSIYVDLSSNIADQNFTGGYVGVGCDNGWLEEWAGRYEGSELGFFNDLAHDIAVDKQGNVYVTGESLGRNEGDLSYDYATVKYNSSGEEMWVARYNGTVNKHDYCNAIALDNSGNVYVTGGSYGDGTGEDYATIKYGPDSNEPVWVGRYDGPANSWDTANAIVIDDSGNVYVTGESHGIVTSTDFTTIKYSPDSNVPVWVARYDGPAHSSDEGEAIAVDSSGNVYVTGSSEGFSNSDIVTIKYDSSGNEVWPAASRYNGPGDGWDVGSGIAVDDLGNVYITGLSSGSGGGDDIVTIKYGPNGNELWVARYTGLAGVDFGGEHIAVDESGNIYVSGTSIGSGTDYDYVTLKYGPDSNEPLWVGRYNGPENLDDIAFDMALDDLGNVYVTGVSSRSSDSSLSDSVTVKYGPDSNEPLWIAKYSGPFGRLVIGEAVAVDDSRNVYVAGYNDAYVTIKYSQCYRPGDCDRDFRVDGFDLSEFCEQWLLEKLSWDVVPGGGDGFVDFLDWAYFADGWHGTTDMDDLGDFVEQWMRASAYCMDIAPEPDGDGFVDMLDFAVFAENWLEGF